MKVTRTLSRRSLSTCLNFTLWAYARAVHLCWNEFRRPLQHWSTQQLTKNFLLFRPQVCPPCGSIRRQRVVPTDVAEGRCGRQCGRLQEPDAPHDGVQAWELQDYWWGPLYLLKARFCWTDRYALTCQHWRLAQKIAKRVTREELKEWVNLCILQHVCSCTLRSGAMGISHHY